ncbi:hypothetical protein SAMN05216249_11635 [Acetitomaculum ruminis DSM 5522]|uniref:Uncharacterized protein n=1 Tax=Acetitomaculum ruminis DSM 5522 TaxID=1120918 RepID=A0A1I0ZQX9_9FIRM|nr:hypothetical protein [Acetitomaculum ruminis]SFB26768.1 hypothetical protein SAMN05216249_11635 [Acetitomaculum ruminis DSM 5522]
MEKYFQYNDIIIPEEEISNLNPDILKDLHDNANKFDEQNIYFILLFHYYHYKEEGKLEVAAYFSYLLSNYTFTCLKPLYYKDFSLRFAKEAIKLDEKKLYVKWLEELSKKL